MDVDEPYPRFDNSHLTKEDRFWLGFGGKLPAPTQPNNPPPKTEPEDTDTP